MPDCIRFLRNHVGPRPIILNFAGGVIQDAQRQVLLQRRGDRETEMWGFPGGAVELGESVAEAAIREVAEETGLEIQIVGLLGIYSDYFDLSNLPPLVNDRHQAADIRTGRSAAWR